MLVCHSLCRRRIPMLMKTIQMNLPKQVGLLGRVFFRAWPFAMSRIFAFSSSESSCASWTWRHIVQEPRHSHLQSSLWRAWNLRRSRVYDVLPWLCLGFAAAALTALRCVTSTSLRIVGLLHLEEIKLEVPTTKRLQSGQEHLLQLWHVFPGAVALFAVCFPRSMFPCPGQNLQQQRAASPTSARQEFLIIFEEEEHLSLLETPQFDLRFWGTHVKIMYIHYAPDDSYAGWDCHGSPAFAASLDLASIPRWCSIVQPDAAMPALRFMWSERLRLRQGLFINRTCHQMKIS